MIKVPEIELREENGVTRAYRVSNNREIPIPSYPRVGTDMSEWLRGLSPAALEAARMYYLDKWTWDDNSEKYRFLVDLIESRERDDGILLGYKGKTTVDAAIINCPHIPEGFK